MSILNRMACCQVLFGTASFSWPDRSYVISVNDELGGSSGQG